MSSKLHQMAAITSNSVVAPSGALNCHFYTTTVMLQWLGHWTHNQDVLGSNVGFEDLWLEDEDKDLKLKDKDLRSKEKDL